MTDAVGQVVWEGEFKPFGEAISITGTVTNNLRFPGQYYDSETGLNYNYFRDYNPVIGRYIEADPIGILPRGPKNGMNNLYVYVGNSPNRFTDFNGLMPVSAAYCYNALLEMAALAKQVHDREIGDRRGHCLAHCKVKKGCGPGIGDALSFLISYGKEAFDEAYGWLFGGRDWDPQDIDANEQGRTCPKEKSCEEQCKDL